MKGEKEMRNLYRVTVQLEDLELSERWFYADSAQSAVDSARNRFRQLGRLVDVIRVVMVVDGWV